MKRIISIIFLMMISLISVSADLTTDNEAYYTLDNTLITNNGATYTSDGQLDGAFEFDGVDDYIDTGTSLLTNDDFTINLWFNAEITSSSSAYAILGRENSILIQLYNNKLYFRIYDGGTWNNVEAPFTDTTNWHNVVCKWDKSEGDMIMYLDNVEYINLNGASTMSGTTNELHLGRYYDVLGRYYDGKIDDVAIFNSALTTSQIEELYNSGKEANTLTDTSDLVFYNSLNSLSNDITGNGNTLTNSGATYTSSGKINGAYEFDGSGDYIEGTDITYNGDFSISMWYYLNSGVSTDNPELFDHYESGGNRITIFGNGQSNRGIRWIVKGSNNNFDRTSELIGENSWNYITMTREGDIFTLYKNNISIDTITLDVGTINPNANILLSKYALGNGGYWDGKIDEVSIWDRALTSSEITELYNSGSGLQYPYSSGETPEFDVEISTDIQPFYNSENISIEISNTWTTYNFFQDLITDTTSSSTDNVEFVDGKLQLISSLIPTPSTIISDTLEYDSDTDCCSEYREDYFTAKAGDVLDIDVTYTVGEYDGYVSIRVENLDTGTYEDLLWYENGGGTPYSSSLDTSYTIPDDGDWKIKTGTKRTRTTSDGYSEIYINDYVINNYIKEYENSGIFAKSYTLTQDINKFNLYDTRTTNGGIITTILIYDEIAYELNSSDLDLNVSSGETIEIKYYLTGDTSYSTPTIENIYFTGKPTIFDIEVIMNYYLDGGSKINMGNYTYYNLDLNSLSDGEHNIIIEALDEYGAINLSEDFTIDTTSPNIAFIGNITEQQSFEVDFSGIFNVTDSLSGMLSCKLRLLYLEEPREDSNFNINCDDTQTFTRAGLYNGFITATDNAGNIETLSLNGSINPFVYIYFEDINNDEIEIYNIELTNPNNEVTTYTDKTNPIALNPIVEGVLVKGIYTIEFTKLGFLTTEITYNMTELSNVNITYNIQNSKIVLNVYDSVTNELITEDIELTLIETNYTDTINTGSTNISQINFYDGDYQILLESANYETESIYFSYTNQEILGVNAYMIKSNETNLGTLEVSVESSIDVIPNQLVNLLGWSSEVSAFVTVGQSRTNSNGKAYFNIELGNRVYKVTAQREGVVQTSTEQLIKIDGTTIYLTFPDAFTIDNTYKPNEIIYNLTQTPINSTHSTFTFSWSDPNNLVTNACIQASRVYGSTVTILGGGESCAVTPAGELEITTTINNTFTKMIEIVVWQGENRIKLDSITLKSSADLETSLGSMAKWFVLILILASMGLGLALGNVNILGIGTIIVSWLVYGLFSATIPYTLPLLITIVMILMLWGTFKKRF